MSLRLPLLTVAVLALAAAAIACAAPPVVTAPTPVVTSTVTPTATPFVYTVQSGDTLWGIAERFDVSGETLIMVNELSDPNLLQPGQQMLISHEVTISGTPLPTATPTTEPCIEGCREAVTGCTIKAFRAQLDGTMMYTLPGDELYNRVTAELWFCQESRAGQDGWVRWTAFGPANK